MTMKLTHLQKAVALLESIESGDQTPIKYINPNTYIQHNLAIGDGLAGFGAVIKSQPKEGFKVHVVRAFADGNYVVTHTKYDFFGPKIGFDVFRFEEGLIVEHWDNLVEVKEDTSSGHSQIDGATEIKNEEETEFNKKFIEEFIHYIFIEREYDRLNTYFFDDSFIQHEVSVGDGVANLQQTIKNMVHKDEMVRYEKNHIVLGLGNFVLSISEGKLKGKHTAFYDLFRVEGNNIKEHWDIREAIPPKSKWKNNNGKFNFN